MEKRKLAACLFLLSFAFILATCGGDGGGGGGGDTVAPSVTSTGPADGATGVATDSLITATFNEQMDASTIDATTFTVSGGGSNLTGTVTYDSGTRTATFTPSGSFALVTLYTATITTGVKDVAGNALTANYIWSFTSRDEIWGTGAIAYVRSSTGDIHAISPDGTGDRVLWTIPQPFVDPAYELAWRPDGLELAFSSGHEQACSWYDSDVYAIGPTGTGYRRVTNSPACAALAGLPKGSVTVNVNNYTTSLVWVYVQGAPSIKTVLGGYVGTVTFDDVADFGPGVHQPSIGIGGLDRFTSYPPYADVQPGQMVPGGNLTIGQYSGFRGFGAGKVSWKADGSALAYGLRTNSAITQIPANPPYGSIGADLPVVEQGKPGLVAWGSTLATKDQYLYSSYMSIFKKDVGGIYLNTMGDASGGTQVVLFYDYSAEYVHDIEWLPDGSGFLFTKFHVELGYFSDIYEYNFATQKITQLTPSLNDESGDGGARGLSISPDGQQIVFERAVYLSDTPSSLWIINRDGSSMHKLADDAGRPAWRQIP